MKRDHLRSVLLKLHPYWQAIAFRWRGSSRRLVTHMNVETMLETLSALEELFVDARDASWAKAFQALLEEVQASDSSADVSDASRKILHMYRGMGSFNDVLIYTNGTYPRGPNEELDLLRHRLYEIALYLA